MNKEIIEDKLIDIGIPMRLKGFKYIVEIIVLIDAPEWERKGWIDIYKFIAKNYGTKYTNVERDIRTAFEVARDEVYDYDVVDRYLGFQHLQNSSTILRLKREIKKDQDDSWGKLSDDVLETKVKKILAKTFYS